MWSLPDINAGNKAAAVAAKKNQNKTEAQLCRGKKCDQCGKKAKHALPYYDVFSDDIKGYIYSCDEHEEGAGEEGYFLCNECGKLHIENYTWERYYTVTENGTLCLNCALDQHLADPDNWITDAAKVTTEMVRKSPHLIPNSGKYWERFLTFLGNVEFDSTSGRCISGGGEGELQELVEKGIESQGKAILILDSAYQFAVSVGVYVPLSKAQGKKAA